MFTAYWLEYRLPTSGKAGGPPLHSRVDIAPPASTLPVRPTQSPIQWVQRTIPSEVKRPALEANRSLPSIAELKIVEHIPPTLLTLL